MAFLSVHAGKVLTYAAIIQAVWGYSDYGSVKKLQVNMKNIRKKMGVTPGEKRYIINELGVGYRMLAEDEDSAAKVLRRLTGVYNANELFPFLYQTEKAHFCLEDQRSETPCISLRRCADKKATLLLRRAA